MQQQERSQELLNRETPLISVTESIQKAIEIFKRNMGHFVIFTLLLGAISAFLTSISGPGWIASLFVSPQLIAGLMIVGNKLKQGEQTSFEDFFQGFQQLVPLFLLWLVMSILVALGYALLIIPGIYLSVAYSLALPFVVFEKMDFWTAMETSRKIVSRQWFTFFGLLMVLALLNLAGALALVVGLLFTLPITFLTLFVVYEKIISLPIHDDMARPVE